MARVMAAMSGGVDSSVAAARLQAAGHQVVGVTLKLLDQPEPEGGGRACCSLEAARAAQVVCRRLGLAHYTLGFSELFRREVIRPFVAGYVAGLTPNPCPGCNRSVKWGKLLRLARGVGCAYLATGHYARVQDHGGRWQLLRGADPAKDQSYVLYALTQEQLAHTLLPLGELTKARVREIAAELELPTADSAESQDLCFLPAGEDYRELLAREGVPAAPGPIVDEQGREIGRHRGLGAYTVGQRKGLGGGAAARLYVLAKAPAGNRLIVGPREALARREVSLARVNWVSRPPPAEGSALRAEVELRYRARPVPCEARVEEGDRLRLTLAPHDQAVSPGQAAVLYEDDRLLGGGMITA